jgi:protein kinase-like protein
MPGESMLQDVAAAVADGAAVDWAELERRVTGDEERRLLRGLRLLAQVGQLHESTDASADETTEAPAGSAESITHTSTDTPRWGRYELRERIGQGGQGSVYRAWDPQLECEVALKVMRSDLAGLDRLGERILREGRALARVRHPHVVNVYGVEMHQGQIGLCMEFIRGRTLEDVLLSQGPFGAQEAAAIGVSVCRALAAVHAAGLVHRDIKGRNVMREEKGRVVLMDFGTGRDHAQLARSGRGDLTGTPLYMAPEVLGGEPASQKSDIYSIGVLLYHLVTGGYPVEGNTFGEIQDAHTTARRRPLAERRPDLPGSFIRIVDKATAAEPAQRYDSVAVLVHDLLGLDDESVRPAPTRTVAQQVAIGAAVFAGPLVAAVLFGFINTMAFNAMLERSSVAGEGPTDWLVWGLRSMLAPVANLAQLFIGALIVAAIWRLLRKVSGPVDDWAARIAASGRRMADRIGIRDAEAFGQLALVLSAAYFGIVLLMHWPLISAIASDLSHLTDRERFLLSPANDDQHYTYRSMLDVLVLASGLAIYRLVRLRRERPTMTASALVAGLAGVFVLAVIMWAAPYRLLFQADRPAVRVEGRSCYDLGRSNAQVLVYCPGAEPRVRRVDERTAEDTGLSENIFIR